MIRRFATHWSLLLASLGAVSLILAAPAGVLAAAGRTSGPNTNQGDVWVDGYSSPQAPVSSAGPGHEMDPHLGCPAYIILWGSGLADTSGMYTIDGWHPSGSGTGDFGHNGYHQDQAWPGTKAHPSTATWNYDTTVGGTQEISYITTATLVADAIANGDAPVNGEGLHFKLQFVQDPQKHKTFWVNCPTSTPPPPGAPGVSVNKTNNASGTGYAKDEVATSAGETVPFRAVITNTSSVSETITSIIDVYPGVGAFPVCGSGSTDNLIGKVLSPVGQAGDSVTCSFLISDYAPAPGTSLTDTVTVEVAANNKTASASSESTVTTPSAPGSPGVSVDKTNDASGHGYGKDEFATSAGETVPFHAVITNTSSVSETITSISDSYSGTSAPECTGLIGSTLGVGDSVTCNFSITGYAPAAGSSLTDTVTVTVSASGQTAAASSESTVTTPSAPGSPGVSVNKTNNASGTGYAKIEFGTVGETVPFRAVITNTSSVSETITSITDSYSGTSAPECTELIGSTLRVGRSVTCNFSIDGYGPAAGTSLTDNVTVEVAANGQTASANSQSVVITPAAPSTRPSSGGPDLIVTKVVNATTTTLGQTLTYTITVDNTGTAAATDVVMNDVMSGTAAFHVNQASFTFLPPVSNLDFTGAGSFTWEYPTLAAGEAATLTYTAVMLAPGNLSVAVNHQFTLTNTVAATSGNGGCTSTHCISTVTTTAPAPAHGVLGATTTKKTPSTKAAGAVLGASTSTPGTGAHLEVLLTIILVLAGLSLIGLAAAARRRANPQA